MTFVTNISYPPQVFEQSLFLFQTELLPSKKKDSLWKIPIVFMICLHWR